MYIPGWKNRYIIKLVLGIGIIIVTGCTPNAGKTSELIHTENMVSAQTPIPLPTIMDVPMSTSSPTLKGIDVPAHLLPCNPPAPTDVSDYKYHLPMFSTTWSLPDIFYISSIAIGPNDVQWFATTNGVLRLENSAWTRFTTTDGLPDVGSTSIQVMPNGIAWVITKDGIVYNFNGKGWKRMGETSVVENTTDYYMNPNNYTPRLALSINGDIWAIGLGGIFSYDGRNWKHHTITIDGAPPVEEYRLLDIEAGPDGTVWFMTKMNSDSKLVLFRYDGTQWTSIVIPDMPRISNMINSMAIPSDGSIWVGGNGGEEPCGLLAHYDGTNWKTYSIANGLADDYINDIAVTADELWFTTPWGVYRFDGKTFETISNINGYGSITISPTGEVWLGGWNWGEVTRIPSMNN